MRVTDDDIALAHRLADAAGAAIRPYFRGSFGLEIKPDTSPVTLADRAAEEAMRRLIVAERPRDAVQGEEFAPRAGDSGRMWVLDPIDGTHSFVSGRAIFGTLIALVVDGWPVLGVIDQPVQRERWVGVVGRPTTFNGVAVKTRSCPDLTRAALATSSPHYFSEDDAARYLALVAATKDAGKTGPLYGGDCYNYGLLASGHLDLVVEAGLQLHDFAALVPVVEGAGGRMCDWAGDPLHAGSTGHVVAAGDPARIEVIIDLLGAHAH
ncbi:MAG: inositol monophosphatase family protein [Pseudomonadota bacterium]